MRSALRPDPSFHASPRLAMEAERERHGYTALLSPDGSRPDAIGVVDLDPGSRHYGRMVHRLDMPYRGDEFHHFGWNACSSALSPMSMHTFVPRRWLVVPGLRSSRIYIIDTEPDPLRPTIAKVIEPEEVLRKTATIPAEPAAPADLPPLLQGFGAVPPLVSDIDLSLDDRFLYVACWGTGELRQYDVTDPMAPRLAGSVRLGGAARHDSHPAGHAFAGGPQMVEISRDGRRVYFTNGLYSRWDAQFYPGGVRGAQVMCHVGPEGGLALDREFFVDFGPEFGAHQVRLQGGDCSTDSFCYPSA